MPEIRYTETDRLANVMDAIQLGKKTGLLRVTRGEGNNQEEGSIIFVNGQPIQAQMGSLNDASAVEWLSSWGPCRFAFQPTLPTLKSGPSSVRPYQASPVTGRLGEKDPKLSIVPFSPQIRAEPLSPGMPDSGTSYPASAPLPVLHRVRSVEDALRLIEHFGFSRAHRRLFLLIDGQRTLKDLVILMNRPAQELMTMVDQLMQAGLIQK